jgi:hypothetical protein
MIGPASLHLRGKLGTGGDEDSGNELNGSSPQLQETPRRCGKTFALAIFYVHHAAEVRLKE